MFYTKVAISTQSSIFKAKAKVKVSIKVKVKVKEEDLNLRVKVISLFLYSKREYKLLERIYYKSKEIKELY